MTIADMLRELEPIQAQLERINDALKPLANAHEWTQAWDNAQVAYLTSGPLVTRTRMLRNLLQRVQEAEGRE